MGFRIKLNNALLHLSLSQYVPSGQVLRRAGCAGQMIEIGTADPTKLESQAAHTEFAQPIRAIGERIDDFDFDQALELLNALRELMKSRTSDSATLV